MQVLGLTFTSRSICNRVDRCSTVLPTSATDRASPVSICLSVAVAPALGISPAVAAIPTAKSTDAAPTESEAASTAEALTVLTQQWRRCSQLRPCHACMCHGTPVFEPSVSCEIVGKGSTGWGAVTNPTSYPVCPTPLQSLPFPKSSPQPTYPIPVLRSQSCDPSLAIPVLRRLMSFDVIAATPSRSRQRFDTAAPVVLLSLPQPASTRY